jgi:hypothetical protein
MMRRTLQRWSCCKRRVDSEPREEEERRGRSGEDAVDSRDLPTASNQISPRSAPNPRKNPRSTSPNLNIPILRCFITLEDTILGIKVCSFVTRRNGDSKDICCRIVDFIPDARRFIQSNARILEIVVHDGIGDVASSNNSS